MLLLLKKQLDLYNPNIIVCCGSSNNPSKPRMLEIAMKYFYQDYSFEKINNFCYYCRDKHLLLIDSFHPTSPINKIDKFNEMFKSYNAFLKLQDK